jgi:hypothetical protein
MAKRDTKVSDLCKELGVTRQTLYRFVGPKGELLSRRSEAAQAQGAERQLLKEHGTNNRALINRQTWSQMTRSRLSAGSQSEDDPLAAVDHRYADDHAD